MNAYCGKAMCHPVHASYHDHEYGVPVSDERELFERLCLEIFQAGLSWDMVLKKRSFLRRAFHAFNPVKVAEYNASDIARLLADDGIIRNRLKIESVIENARKIIVLRKTHGGFPEFLAMHHPRARQEWVVLFKKHFKFVGGEIVGEFLMSIGYLPGSHAPECPVGQRLRQNHDFPWLAAQEKK